MKKLVYTYDEADPRNRRLLGGKGAGLVLMYKQGLPVPPASPSPPRLAGSSTRGGEKLPEGLMDQVREAIRWLESKTGKGFCDPSNPLLVSVRSGAPVSMPGMMDTILNLGINDRIVESRADTGE